jgi:hypothetical protein
MKPRNAIVSGLLIFLLSGCAATWVRVDDANQRYRGEHYSVTLPAGWMRSEVGDNLVLSRDGLDLQRIVIEYRPHDKAFEHLEKTSSVDMLPSELAELTIAELKAAQDEGLPSLEILDNRPVEIAGYTGYALHLRFRTDAGLRIEVLLQGFVDENGLYQLLYRAPTLHYFGRDREVYESVAGSLQQVH